MNPTLNKKVSIIIPCYNSEKYIEECIESALNQDYNNIEVIVIDDGSTDNSLKKIKRYQNQIVIIEQKNQGACAARNNGLKSATGEFIKFLDADDYLAPSIIKSQTRNMNKLDSNSIIFGDLTQIHGSNYIKKKYNKINEKFAIEYLINNGIITSLPLHRKKLLDHIGGFDIRFKNCQEWNLHIRLAASGVKFIHSPENVYFQRFHNGPDRISNKKNNDFLFDINKHLMTLESIKKLCNLSDSIKQAMAFRLWNIGRKNLLLDNHIAAEKLYKASIEVYPSISRYFSKKYRFLSLFINPLHIEKIIYLRKKFTRNIIKKST